MGIISEEPVISRLDRLDNMLRQLEEMKGCNSNSNRSGRSSCASTPSSGTLTSTGTEGQQYSSVDLMISISPNTLEKHCRPIDHVMMETQVKGSLIQRLDKAEERLLKLCLRLEEELEAEKKRELDDDDDDDVGTGEKIKPHSKGIKQFVKECVKGKSWKHKSRKDI